MIVPRLRDSLLARGDVQRLLVVCALGFGGATWGLEAILSRIVRGAPDEPLGGVYRLVEAVLWIGASAIAIRVAERWPIEHAAREWRRTLAQLALAIALGPVWGMIAYAMSPYLMPWWHERGLWGVVAKEAKGALLGYGVTAVLVHVVLRARRQRAREVAASAMERAAADAQLVVRRLELQPGAVLRALDAIARMIPRDVDAANEALVALADGMRRSVALTRVESVPLREELKAVEDALRLRALTVGPEVTLVLDAADGSLDAMVPTLLLPPIVDGLIGSCGQAHRSRIVMTVRHPADRLILEILLPGPDDAHDDRRESPELGWLFATRQRLQGVRGGADVSFASGRDGARVLLDLPCENAGAGQVVIRAAVALGGRPAAASIPDGTMQA
jgi:hypothetical protein